MPSVQALERLHGARSIASGIALAFAKSGQLPESIRQEKAEAFHGG